MMTYREICKALECCSISNNCYGCPLVADENDCKEMLMFAAFNLINHYKEEIERLLFNNEALKRIKIFLQDSEREEIREEAIEEFAAKLKEHKCSYDLDNYHSFEAIDVDDIDEVVKEFLGEEE